MALPAEKIPYTLSDYLSWEEGVRIELIYGEAIIRNTPSTAHQRIVGELYRQLANFLDDKPCLVFVSPIAVRLFEEKDDRPQDVDTVVEPDILVVCDNDKLDEIGCKGAPDLVVEVLSPSTRRHDRIVKFNLYQKAGVREYWLIDPEIQTVEVFLLHDSGQLVPTESYSRTDLASVGILPDCTINLEKVFPDANRS
jgi:Uma2 family endonuclease